MVAAILRRDFRQPLTVAQLRDEVIIRLDSVWEKFEHTTIHLH